MEARQRYADVRIIIAHLGRAYCPIYMQKGLVRLRDWTGFCFDTTAVINRSTYRLAFEKISMDGILYGSEMPILFLPWKAQVDEIFV